MDKNYLDKVLDQIVSETRIDYEKEKVYTPFTSYPLTSYSLFISYTTPFPLTLLRFRKHCRDVYGLNEQEIEYVWEEYRQIIKDKLKNNG